MRQGSECALEQDERLTTMLNGLVSQAAGIATTAVELQQIISGRGNVLQKSMAPSDLYNLKEIADVMDKALLAWSCDPRRPVDRGLDVWERATIVDMAIDALASLRRT